MDTDQQTQLLFNEFMEAANEFDMLDALCKQQASNGESPDEIQVTLSKMFRAFDRMRKIRSKIV